MSWKHVFSHLGAFRNNLKGWSDRQKILVIESDDWGSIRMSSKAAYDNLLAAGMRVDQNPFLRYDALAKVDDLHALYELAARHRDRNGRPLCITANAIMTNPDFKKIKAHDFTAYYYEDLQTSLKRTYPAEKTFAAWREGGAQGLFYPQLHGREHLNFKSWLSELRRGNQRMLLAFEHGVYGIREVSDEEGEGYLAAFDYDDPADYENLPVIIAEAQALFYKLFGKYSRSFIAPNYVWGTEVEKQLARHNVRYIQSSRHQLLPVAQACGASGKSIRHYVGETNSYGQIYLVRNCYFEPAVGGEKEVGRCLRQIAWAFRMNKPAIISSHRLNYIGAIHEDNRTENLKLLDLLLKEVLKRWPDVVFLNSEELGDRIAKTMKA